MAIDIEELWLDVIGEDFKLIRLTKGIVLEYSRQGMADEVIRSVVMERARRIYDDLPDESRTRKLDLIAGAVATVLEDFQAPTTLGAAYPALARRFVAGSIAFVGAGY